MPSIKYCPRCEKPHKKPGTYCSRSCANVRVHNEISNQKRSIAKTKWLNSTDGQKEKNNIIKANKKRKLNKLKKEGLSESEIEEVLVEDKRKAWKNTRDNSPPIKEKPLPPPDEPFYSNGSLWYPVDD